MYLTINEVTNLQGTELYIGSNLFEKNKISDIFLLKEGMLLMNKLLLNSINVNKLVDIM